MNYQEWIKMVPVTMTDDPLWRMEVYRLALFVGDVGWQDVTKLMRDKRTLDLSDQLYSALGSIGANLSEGYSRGSGRDRARFYEYALGSARESRGWSYSAHHVLGEQVVEHRMSMLTHIIRLLLTIAPNERGLNLGEESVAYQTESDQLWADTFAAEPDLPMLFPKVPSP